MYDIANASNVPIKFALSGKDYSIKRLSIMDLMGVFEADVKQSYMDDILEYANKITDSKERIEFQRSAIKDIPKGADLEQRAQELMASINGSIKLFHIALNKCQKVSLDQAKELMLDPQNSSVMTNLLGYISGSDIEEKEKTELPKDAVVIDTEKKII